MPVPAIRRTATAPRASIDRIGISVGPPTKPLSSLQDLCTLYIATAPILGGDAHRLAGSLFALDADVLGAAAFRAKV